MRYPLATWRPGPTSKQGYPGAMSRTGKGVVLHSMEGSLAAALGELDNLERRASWHFSNPKSGPLLAHYELEAVTWHAGYEANRLYVGVEHEGVAGQPLTESQIANDVGLLQWLWEKEHWLRFERRLTLWEHNEFMATACPSGRIPWAEIIRRLTTVTVDELGLMKMFIRLGKLGLDGKLQELADALAFVGVRPR